MAKIFNIKSGKMDKVLKRVSKLYLRGIIHEERILMGPIVNTLYTEEMALLAMLLTGIDNLSESHYNLNGKDRGYITNEAVVYCAHMDIILSYIKKSEQKRRNPVDLRLLYRPYRISSYLFPAQNEAIFNVFEEALRLKGNSKTDIEQLSNSRGMLFSAIAKWSEDKDFNDLSQMAYYYGKFSYMMECYDKLKSDEKNGRYNPLVFLKMRSPEIFEAYCRSNIKSCADTCLDCFNKLKLYRNEDLLHYFFYVSVSIRYEDGMIKNLKRGLFRGKK